MGKVMAVNISEKRGTQKVNVHTVKLIENYGLENDAHAGNWHRQVSDSNYMCHNIINCLPKIYK